MNETALFKQISDFLVDRKWQLLSYKYTVRIDIIKGKEHSKDIFLNISENIK